MGEQSVALTIACAATICIAIAAGAFVTHQLLNPPPETALSVTAKAPPAKKAPPAEDRPAPMQPQPKSVEPKRELPTPSEPAAKSTEPTPSEPQTATPAPRPVEAEKAETTDQAIELKTAATSVLNATYPEADIAALKRARTTRKKRGIVAVTDELSNVSSTAAKDLLTWWAAVDGSRRLGASKTREFAATHKGFPRRERIIRNAESALLLDGAKADAINDYFASSEPQSGEGKAALARAKKAAGDTDAAKQLISDAWRNHSLNQQSERAILKEFKSLLTDQDHLLRADQFLLNDSRWRGTRARRSAPVKRLLGLVGKENKQILQARLAVYLKQRNARKLFSRLPKKRLKDWSVMYHRIQLARRSKKHELAWKLIRSVPPTREAMVQPDGWWIERRVNAYEALNSGKPQIAYDIVSKHGPVTVNPENEAEFMSGWIALRFLNKPKVALTHFRNMTQTADGPRTRGQSHYWLARTQKRLGEKDAAEEALQLASREITTFYGQVAKQTLDKGHTELAIETPPSPTIQQADAFAKNPAIRAMVLAHRIGDTTTTRSFIARLRYHMRDPVDLAILAELALQMGDTQMSLRVGKAAMLRGYPLAEYAYPVGALPDYDPLREPLEEAFLYAIARQESEFNTLIQSGAGARGILQVMPITARHICRQYKIKCEIGRLKKDPSYNTRIASAYIADRNSDFGGSYVMTMPGYNAGPGRVRGWVRRNGDPRKPGVDPIDWIERLHIKETREYTKKVLANIQVYRARLGDAANALQIWRDIMRARKGDPILSAPRLTSSQN